MLENQRLNTYRASVQYKVPLAEKDFFLQEVLFSFQTDDFSILRSDAINAIIMLY